MQVTAGSIKRRTQGELAALAQRVVKGELQVAADYISIQRVFGLILQLIRIEPDAAPLIGALVGPPAGQERPICLDVDFIHTEDWPVLAAEIWSLDGMA